ncbi:MAG: glutamine--tRNA ligase/YqeY domain fusion protein [Deltaproteobacteria bacterium]|nr:glutamine--tRNA ligase/YqeY domain fusion protein [Deltaproteobacteria bacterium]
MGKADLDEKSTEGAPRGRDFIREIIDADLQAGRHTQVVTRFPPEPNGFLHIGHAKSICLNFGLAAEYGGRCHLRFDDTNPTKEDVLYERSIAEDIAWLGFDWGEHRYHASDYFERLHDYAVELVEKGLAYVCSQTLEEMREARGTVTEAGRPSPDRDRPVEESLDLFRRMRAGEFPDGALTLRAKIDMANANMKMRDPALYRIRHAAHHRAGDAWCIYPMYDFAHCLSDSIEGITHSICTLEFENNRELYDWILDNVEIPLPRPHQYEFARLNLTHTVMSKRKLLRLVEEELVAGWDDPRMPTIAGLRRRGVRPSAIRAFADMIGVAKANSMVDLEKLEYCIRDDLNRAAPRRMAVLRPLKVVLTDYPEEKTERFDCPDFPPDALEEGATSTSREVPFGRELYIERDDFQETPEKGYKRLAPGREVRLRHAYLVTCQEVVRGEDGEIAELRCTHDPASRGGKAPDGRKVMGTIHWVSARDALSLEARLYDRLFLPERPDAAEGEFEDHLDPDSLKTLTALAEPSLKDLPPGGHVQLERQGYFFADPADSAAGRPVLNRTVTLKDSWGRKDAPAGKPAPRRPAAEAAAPALRKVSEAARELAAADGLDEAVAEALCATEGRLALYRAALEAGASRETAGKWIANVLVAQMDEAGAEALPFDGAAFAELCALLDAGTITATAGKEVLLEMVGGGGRPEAIVEARGLARVADGDALASLVSEVLAEHPDELERYRAGKKNLLGFFLGMAMKKSGGAADPGALRAALQEALDS